jgi:alanine-glyoxylate transaminase/serine-glyoxylate transaminase/serine-pyruvate transaminase
MTDPLEAIHEVLLMGPGPSLVPPEVYQAIARPTIGHLDPRFVELMDKIKDLQKQVMRTENALTIPISGTGSAGMETCLVNLIESGTKVLVAINGVFGQRMQDVAGRCGAIVDTVEFDWGKPVEPGRVAEKLRSQRYDLVCVVHAETSTGVCNPIAEISQVVEPTGAMLLVDAVTSLGGMEVNTDQWKIDALYSGTQKCLSCPPGLAPVSLSDRAVQRIQARKTKVASWYLDLTMIINYWQGQKRSYHHTAPINMLYAFYAALKRIVDEGLENVFARHKQAHEQLVESLGDLGLELLVDPPYRLPMLNAVKVPDGVDEADVRKKLLMEHDIEIGAGLGPLAGQIWRIGLMGYTAGDQSVQRLTEALKTTLGR